MYKKCCFSHSWFPQILAKQLINIRKQKTRMLGMKGQIGAVKSKTSTMQASMNMAQTMKTTTGVMGQMNKQMNPQVS